VFAVRFLIKGEQQKNTLKLIQYHTANTNNKHYILEMSVVPGGAEYVSPINPKILLKYNTHGHTPVLAGGARE
jgi:hypothetical protein